MFENLKADYLRYGGKRGNLLLFFPKALRDAGFRTMMLYRVGHSCRKHHLGVFGGICERLMRHLCLCWISTKAEIDGGLRIAHGIGLIIGDGTRIGKNCDVRQNTTFGGNYGKVSPDGRRQPWLGDNVSVGAGACILGPVRIGSNSVIGANAVVTKDVPENVIVGGVPAQIIKDKWDESTERKL
jgi:serine O-acetyltransferase